MDTTMIVALIFVGAIAVILVFIIMIAVYASRYKKVPPDQAMVVYGKAGSKGRAYDIVTGGGKFILPIVQAYAFMPLDVRTLEIIVTDIITDDANAPHQRYRHQRTPWTAAGWPMAVFSR